jgi:hypothetical protein
MTGSALQVLGTDHTPLYNRRFTKGSLSFADPACRMTLQMTGSAPEVPGTDHTPLYNRRFTKGSFLLLILLAGWRCR